MKIKEKVLSTVKYVKWAVSFPSRLLPSTHHMKEDKQPSLGYLVAEGVIERDGKQYHYQDIRLLYPHD